MEPKNFSGVVEDEDFWEEVDNSINSPPAMDTEDVTIVASTPHKPRTETFICSYSRKAQCCLPELQNRQNVLKCRTCKSWFHHMCANKVHGSTDFSTCGFCVRPLLNLETQTKETNDGRGFDFQKFFTEAPCSYKGRCTKVGVVSESKCERCCSTFHSECCPLSAGQGCPCYFLHDLHWSDDAPAANAEEKFVVGEEVLVGHPFGDHPTREHGIIRGEEAPNFVLVCFRKQGSGRFSFDPLNRAVLIHRSHLVGCLSSTLWPGRQYTLGGPPNVIAMGSMVASWMTLDIHGTTNCVTTGQLFTIGDTLILVCGFHRTSNGDTRVYLIANPTAKATDKRKLGVFSMDVLPFKQALIAGTICVHEGATELDSPQNTERVLLEHFFDAAPPLPRLRLNEPLARQEWIGKLNFAASPLQPPHDKPPSPPTTASLTLQSPQDKPSSPPTTATPLPQDKMASPPTKTRKTRSSTPRNAKVPPRAPKQKPSPRNRRPKKSRASRAVAPQPAEESKGPRGRGRPKKSPPKVRRETDCDSDMKPATPLANDSDTPPLWARRWMEQMTKQIQQQTQQSSPKRISTEPTTTPKPVTEQTPHSHAVCHSSGTNDATHTSPIAVPFQQIATCTPLPASGQPLFPWQLPHGTLQTQQSLLAAQRPSAAPLHFPFFPTFQPTQPLSTQFIQSNQSQPMSQLSALNSQMLQPSTNLFVPHVFGVRD
eukprot:c18424_g1_i1.p1 GENE.c18424_g1_i1~~c18424_g1_i1.p1  ORF type:complete len:710 (-),score=80.99 c18424_g1_i1:529-2658(-)